MAVHIVKISADNRSELGSRAMKRLRDKGMLPGVIYGHKQDTLPISMSKKEVTNHLNKGAHLFELNISGKIETALLKEAQFDYLGIELIHIDFARVSLDEKVKVKVPLELKGEPIGVKDGGVLQQIISDIEIECRVLDIPDFIRHNITEMGLDSNLHVKDIKFPDGVKPMMDGEQIVATVKEVQEVVVAPVAGEAGAEPEVITAKKPEEAAAGEAKPGEKKAEKK